MFPALSDLMSTLELKIDQNPIGPIDICPATTVVSALLTNGTVPSPNSQAGKWGEKKQPCQASHFKHINRV